MNLILNPGSTSTKIAVHDGNLELLSKSVKHPQAELEKFNRVMDQKQYRADVVMEALKEQGIDFSRISGLIAIGGLLHAGLGGVYEVNETMVRDLMNCTYGEHAANLGGVIAAEIAARLNIKAYIADPITTDELQEVARLSGMPDIIRSGKTHTLNQKAAAKQAAAELGLSYKSARLIVVHLGGGISVAAHRDGLIVDTSDPRGEGPFCMDRCGGISTLEVAKLCFSGKYSKDEMLRIINGNGGIAAYLNTRDFFEVMKMYNDKDPKAVAVYNALVYQIAKEIGAMAAILKGKVDAIVFTGGMAREACFIEDIKEYINYLAKVLCYPGEFELEALVAYINGVQNGEIKPQIYTEK